MTLIVYCISIGELLADTERYNQGMIESYGSEYHVAASNDPLYKKMAWEIIRTDAERTLKRKEWRVSEAEIYGFNKCLRVYE